MYPTFSIVINTLNRAAFLQRTLESFQWIKYPGAFEVIVVNGPSTDNSDEVIASWSSQIRAGKCDVANLSVSRNIGICMARGDIVAFLDDDAIPEPEWLTQMAQAYADPMVGAVGGRVYDHTGYAFQYEYCVVNRFAGIDFPLSAPAPHFSFPKSGQIPHLLGCNSSFRRSALLEIGGFDEEFEYFLDETDVCVRIVDAGYIIAQLHNAYVHHKCAPSNVRSNTKVLRHRYPIVKNKVYFSLKHGREFHSLETVFEEQKKFCQDHRNDVQRCVDEGLLTQADKDTFEADVERALEVGMRRGFEGVRAEDGITPSKLYQHSGTFVPFTCRLDGDNKTIVLVSRDFPPHHGGGIATFNKDLAESLAAQGNVVHVITASADINRVDFENGVWLHRLIVAEVKRTPEAVSRRIPQAIWDWSATALKEAKRIAQHRTIDVVETPIWDCEGAAFLLDASWPLVTSLQTTLHFWLESHPEMKSDSTWMKNFCKPMLALEREIMSESHAIRAISKAIAQEIEQAYSFTFAHDRLNIVPLGMSPDSHSMPMTGRNELSVLYVGRLERRKGIDVLLQAIPTVLESCGDVTFRIVGHDTSTGTGKAGYTASFLDKHAGQPWLSRVTFEGRVDEEALKQAYVDCDIFVAPSRFESFGLVFLEAMRVGKPVIGCYAGGMPEVVSANISGILVEPGNVEQLAQALLSLIRDEDLRRAMGEKGKAIFDDQFTASKMGERSRALYESAAMHFGTMRA